jgi:hypothetical protein
MTIARTLQKLFRKPPRATRAPKARLQVEALETRELLSGFAVANDGTLTHGSQVVDTNVASFATDNAGNVFELKTNGHLWELTAATNAWALLDTNVGNFQANSAGQLEEAKTSGNLWDRSAAGMWALLSDNVETAGIDSSGNVYFLKHDSSFNEWNGLSATTSSLADKVVSFQMGGAGNNIVYYMTTDEQIYCANTNLNVTSALDSGGSNQWILNIPEYAVASDGSLYLSVHNKGNNTNALIRFGSGMTAPDVFDPLPSTGSVAHLQLTPDKSMLYYVYIDTAQKTDSLWRYDVKSASYTDLLTVSYGNATPDQLGQLYVGGDDAGYAVDIHFTGSTTTTYSLYGAAGMAGAATLLDSSVNSLQTNPAALAPNGNMFVLGDDGTVTNFNIDAPGGSTIDTGVFQIGVAPSGAFYEVKSNGNFWTWTGSDNWTMLDSNLVWFAVGGNGAVFEQNVSNIFWTLQAGTWTLIAHNVTQFAVAQDGAVVCIAKNNAWIWTPSLYNPSDSYLVALNQTSLFIDNLDLLSTTGSGPGVNNFAV